MTKRKLQTKLQTKAEQELLYRSLRGEREAWGEIVSRYKGAVYGVILSILKDPTEAEDATQETFIKAWENLGKYDMDKKFSTWLLTVASNVAKNVVRKRDRWSFTEKFPLVRAKENPEREIQNENQKKGIRDAVFSLKPKYRAPIIMRFWCEQSYREISEILDIPIGTVKTRIHRGKEQIKSIYNREGWR
ncbi:MAG: RNA polymerase sigma factor [Candidatus Acetothermia bacterium]